MFKAYFDIQEYELARVVVTYYFNLLSKLKINFSNT